MKVCCNSGIRGVSDALRRATSHTPIVWVGLDEDPEVVIAEGKRFSDAMSLPSVRWLHSTFAGVDGLLLEKERLREGVVVTRTGGFGPAIAEWAIGHFIAHKRHFGAARAAQSEGEWKDEEVGGYKTPEETVVAVLGGGDIGSCVVQSCMGMGYRVRCLVSTMGVESGFGEECVVCTEVGEVVRGADAVINTLPSTPFTTHLLTKDSFSDTKPNSMFLNAGRGSIIAEEELLDALSNPLCPLSAAALDVFPVEPLPSHSPLYSHPNVTITPHIAAVSTPTHVAREFASALDTYLATPDDFEANMKLRRRLVNLEHGY